VRGKHENEIVIDPSRSESVSIDDDFTASQCPFESAFYRFGLEKQKTSINIKNDAMKNGP
jgi:hypothetical protein